MWRSVSGCFAFSFSTCSAFMWQQGSETRSSRAWATFRCGAGPHVYSFVHGGCPSCFPHPWFLGIMLPRTRMCRFLSVLALCLGCGSGSGVAGPGGGRWPCFSFLVFFLEYFVKDFICFQGGREGEKHQCVVASCAPLTGDLA